MICVFGFRSLLGAEYVTSFAFGLCTERSGKSASNLDCWCREADLLGAPVAVDTSEISVA